jgi:uncharacterized protein (DUF924 family)
MNPEGILDFWFRELTPRQWFAANAKLDQAIGRRFGACVDAALRGDLEAWAKTPRGRLALILVLDQFPRNIHRGTPGAFAGDAMAQALVLAGLATGMDKPLNLAERHFFYMPLMHAEDKNLQALSLEMFAAIQREANSVVGYARDHAATIERFGRFPSRNQALGRPSTAEELAFLGRRRSRSRTKRASGDVKIHAEEP